MDTTNDTAWAYFAGFFDGEGSIGIGANNKPAGGVRRIRGPLDNGDGTRRQLALRLSITNTYRPVLEEFSRLLGMSGGIYIHERRRENRRQAFVLATNRMDVVRRAIVGMMPYLREKKERAELALRYIDSRRVGATRRPINADEIAIYERLRALNRPGIERSN